MDADTLPEYLMPLIGQLRRRRIQVGIGDVHALRQALRAGFGLSSLDELCELCVALWAKSSVEAEIVRATFARLRLDQAADWDIAAAEPLPSGAASPEAPEARSDATGTKPVRNIGFGPGPIRAGVDGQGLVLVSQYPLTAREVAQAWRHLRRPVRSGPPVEIDIGATVRERARRAVATPPVLVPRRRNAVRLLMLIDRHGSMTPFHGYVDYVVGAIRDAGRMDDVQVVYFHDLPGSLEDRSALDEKGDPLRPDLDDVLGLIGPLPGGRAYDDPGLTMPRDLGMVISGMTPTTVVVLISDAGAARRRFDIGRLLDTVALLKALRAGGAGVAWLNPVPADWWERTTAGQVARYVPMFPLSRPGLDQAVDALRGRPVLVERPV